MRQKSLSFLTLPIALLAACGPSDDETPSSDISTQDMSTLMDMSDMMDMGTTTDAGMDMDQQPVDMTDSDAAITEDMMVPPALCPENQYVVNNTCVACPEGSSRPAGDDPVQEDTSCTPVLCEADYYVQSHQCVPCPDGQNNEAGDDAQGEDSTCDEVVCLEDQHVMNLACVDCPVGTTRTEGDVASQGDTACHVLYCEANEYVDNNQCLSCPPQSYTEPGADASGDNTACLDRCNLLFGEDCGQVPYSYIKASNTGAGDQFGAHVAILGDTLVVGAPGESSGATGINSSGTDNSAENSGAVYVFERLNDQWQQVAYIKASNANANDLFGSSVALDGDTLVVGAPGESSSASGVGGDGQNNEANSSGAVYVFERFNDQWQQQAYIKASNTDAFDRFGSSVAIYDSTIAVGAPNEDSRATGVNGDQQSDLFEASGAVYTFTRVNNSWLQDAYIKASNTSLSAQFGSSLSLSSQRLAVGAPNEDSNATGVNATPGQGFVSNSGAAYIFEHTGNSWTETAFIKASVIDSDDHFGQSVAINDNQLLVGAPSEDSNAQGINGDKSNNNAESSGAAYYFNMATGMWAEELYIKPSNNTGYMAHFGQSVQLEDDLMAIGAHYEVNNVSGINSSSTVLSNAGSGAAFVLKKLDRQWIEMAYIKAPQPQQDAHFGTSVALSYDRVVISSPEENSNATGVDGDQSNTSAPESGAAFSLELAPYPY